MMGWPHAFGTMVRLSWMEHVAEQKCLSHGEGAKGEERGGGVP
jgi:hypothetical protein